MGTRLHQRYVRAYWWRRVQLQVFLKKFQIELLHRRFSAERENSCYHLKRTVVDGSPKLTADFVFAGSNKIPGSPIAIGRQITFTASCALDTQDFVKSKPTESIKTLQMRQQTHFVAGIFVMLLVFVIIHMKIQKRHQNEIQMLKNKVF